MKPGVLGIWEDAEIFLAFPLEPGDMYDFMSEKEVAERLDELHGGVFVDKETHHAARCAGS
jgi:hypothetical protein